MLKKTAILRRGGEVIRCLCFALLLLLSSTPVTAANNLIVVLKSREIEPYEIALKSFNKTLREKGYDPEVREYLLPADNRAKDDLVADIRRQHPRLILALGSAATAQVSRVVRDTPVVFCMVLNPVARYDKPAGAG